MVSTTAIAYASLPRLWAWDSCPIQERESKVTALAVVVAGLAFTLSASAGLGGSLILVPAMVLAFGAKHGVATAALLLACNNVGKVIVYRSHVPLRAALPVLLATVLGASLGAAALLAVSESVVRIAVIVGIAIAFAFERLTLPLARKPLAGLLALASGASSGFSGTSGPLKGVAIRSLGLDRRRFVGAASVVSLGGDAAKTAVFLTTLRFDGSATLTIAFALLLIPIATQSGRRINHVIGEKAYTGLFWAVMTGYVLRLVVP